VHCHKQQKNLTSTFQVIDLPTICQFIGISLLRRSLTLASDEEPWTGISWVHPCLLRHLSGTYLTGSGGKASPRVGERRPTTASACPDGDTTGRTSWSARGTRGTQAGSPGASSRARAHRRHRPGGASSRPARACDCPLPLHRPLDAGCSRSLFPPHDPGEAPADPITLLALYPSDRHRLFDRGYVTVTPDQRCRVSRKLRDDFHNREEYVQLAGSELWLHLLPRTAPTASSLNGTLTRHSGGKASTP